MRNLSLFVLLSIFILFSCKKKDVKSGDTKPAACPILDPKTITGICWTSIYIENFGNNGLMDTSQSFLARFCFNPQTDVFCNEIASNHISVNDNKLNYTAAGCSSGYIFGKTQPGVSNIDNWSFSGDSIPTFSYANKDPLPSYSDLNFIPDSISKSTGLTFTINVQNLSWGQLTVADSLYGKSTESNVTFTLVPGPNVISLTSSQLLTWATSTTGFVGLNMNNSSIVNACTRNYRFVKQVQVVKRLVVKP
jgi:hypothetical protein